MAMDGEDGWRTWRVIPRLAGGVLAVPVVVGFVALGAAVVVARSVRDVGREAWARLSSLRPGARASEESEIEGAAEVGKKSARLGRRGR